MAPREAKLKAPLNAIKSPEDDRHIAGGASPRYGEKKIGAPRRRSERDGNEGRQKAWLLTCHVHTYGAAAHGFGLTPSPLSVGLPRLRLRLRRYRAPYHFHALPGVLIFGYASMNHPRLFVCRPPDSQIRLAALAGWRQQTSIYQLYSLTEPNKKS